MNNIQLTYKMVKTLIKAKEEIIEWARLAREKKLTDSHQKIMMNKAFEIDEFLREIGVEWIRDYEENQKVKASISK